MRAYIIQRPRDADRQVNTQMHKDPQTQTGRLRCSHMYENSHYMRAHSIQRPRDADRQVITQMHKHPQTQTGRLRCSHMYTNSLSKA